MVGWLDRLQRRNRPVGFAVAVVYKYVDDQGGYLAALITYYAFVSLFPPTYDGTPSGLRVDLMQKIAALHPGYLRIPGGNYLEGQNLSTYFNWKTTIGPVPPPAKKFV